MHRLHFSVPSSFPGSTWFIADDIIGCWASSYTHKTMHACACMWTFTPRGPASSPYMSSATCCFGPNPSSRRASPRRRSNTVFPLDQMKKVKRRTRLPEPQGSARTPRTGQDSFSSFCNPTQLKGATFAQETIITSTPSGYFPAKTHRVTSENRRGLCSTKLFEASGL